MTIDIDGLTASYVPSGETDKKIVKINKQKSALLIFISILLLVNLAIIQMQVWTDINTVILGSIIIALNLIIILIHLLINERYKKAIKDDLLSEDRKEEARHIRIKYKKVDALVMGICFVQVAMQIIN